MGWSRFLRRAYWDDERAQEIQSYIEIETDENIAKGMSAKEARYAAQRKFGNATLIRENIYRTNTLAFIETLWQDLRHAFRSMRRNPGFTATVILTLTLAIGANTTIFSVVDAAMFRPLPYRNPNEIVSVAWTTSFGTAQQITYIGDSRPQEIEDWRAQRQIFSSVETFISPNSSDRSECCIAISTGMLNLLGINPKLGRGFRTEEGEPGKDQVALISEGFWKREFGGKPDTLGKTANLDGRIYTVVGVMPADFQFPPGSRPNAWIPRTEKSDGFLQFIARIRPGANLVQAQKQAALVSDMIHGFYHGMTSIKMTPTLIPYGKLERVDSPWAGGPGITLLIMLGAVGFVLLIACANVANLLLSRGVTLQREVGIRTAVGASRLRLIRQLFIESSVLSITGALVSLLLSWWMMRFIPRLFPDDLQYIFRVYRATLNGRVFLFAVATAILTCILSGLVPAFRTARTGLIAGLAEANRSITFTRSARRFHIVFQCLQVCLALVLLSGAGLMINSFVRIKLTDNGYDTRNLSVVSVSWPRYSQQTKNQKDFSEQLRAAAESRASRQAFCDQLLAAVKAMTGVKSAALTEGTPTSRSNMMYVGPDYFHILGIPLISGRLFNSGDTASSQRVAIVDRIYAKSSWPGQNALGRRFRFSPFVPWVTVVGVVAPIKTRHFTSLGGQAYLPVSQGQGVSSNLIIRTAGDPRPVLSQVRASIAALDRNVTLSAASTLDEQYAALNAEAVVAPRFYLILMSIFSGLALAIAAVGIYGVLSYSVAQRTQEIGIRMALGATASEIRRLVLRALLTPVSIGLIAGIIASLWLARLLRAHLYKIEPGDPITLISAVLFLIIICLAAGYFPSRRAARIDPIASLRNE
jgi:predicted permease